MRQKCGWIAVLFFFAAGCQKDRYSTSGFRLPPDGSAERGKVAFVAHNCNNCHTVHGVELPKPEGTQPVSVPLGGAVPSARSDGYLFASIAYPSYKLASYPKGEITETGKAGCLRLWIR
jgi:hypothetical protein